MAALSYLESLMMVTLLTNLMWIPYVVAECVSNGRQDKLWLDGFWAKMQYDAKGLRVPMPDWAARAKVAHANSIENLVIFATACFVSFAFNVDGIDIAAFAYLLSRVFHYIFALLGPNVPAARTVCFFVGWASITFICSACVAKCRAHGCAFR